MLIIAPIGPSRGQKTYGGRVTIDLQEDEQRWLSGADGPVMQLAMRLISAAADLAGASQLVPIEMAHLNSTHYSGQMSLDFAEFLLEHDATFAVPTHSNTSLISCSSPHIRPEADAPKAVSESRRVMEIYEQLGCSSMWTCAPYLQPEGRPELGQHVVGSESNAVGFYNSALGARTNKYGDLLDVAGALVGRVPYAGRHTDEGRRATHVFDVSGLTEASLTDPNLPHLLGVVIGRTVGTEVGVIVGLDAVDEDDLKAIAAAGAAAGGVEIFHAVGITPEASTLDEATQGTVPEQTTEVSDAMLAEASALLTNATGDEQLRAVCLGTPHFSVTEFQATLDAFAGRRVADDVTMLVTTSRAVEAELALRGLTDRLADAGVEIVLDTCSYFRPKPAPIDGLTMTNSAKWAYYSQGMFDVPVAFASLQRCVESAIAGRWLP